MNLVCGKLNLNKVVVQCIPVEKRTVGTPNLCQRGLSFVHPAQHCKEQEADDAHIAVEEDGGVAHLPTSWQKGL